MKRRKGQTAIEFMVLAGFMLLVFTVFTFVLEERSSVAKEQSHAIELRSVAQSLLGEVQNAYTVHDGYSRVFELPQYINQEDYTVTMSGNSEVTLRTTHGEYLIFLPANLTPLDQNGVAITQIMKGKNIITKSNGNITVQSAPTEIDTCMPTNLAGRPATCFASIGGYCEIPQGATNCTLQLSGRLQQIVRWTTSCGSGTMTTVFNGTPKNITIACDLPPPQCLDDAHQLCIATAPSSASNGVGLCQSGSCYRCDPTYISTGTACVCPAGFTECGSQCVDLDNDGLNCGMCGRSCDAGCEYGACIITTLYSLTPSSTTMNVYQGQLLAATYSIAAIPTVPSPALSTFSVSGVPPGVELELLSDSCSLNSCIFPVRIYASPEAVPGSYTITVSGSDTSVMSFTLQVLPSVVAMWKLDESSGSSATDASSNGLHASAMPNTVTWTAGLRSGAAQLSGGPGFQSASSTPPRNYTIMAWVKPASTATQGIFARGTATSGPWTEVLRIDGGRFQHFTMDTQGKAVYGTTPVTANVWYHVALVATSNDMARLYINGEEDGAAVSVGSIATGGSNFFIGSDGNFDPANFSGIIDHIIVFNRSLSSEDIQQMSDSIACTSIAGQFCGSAVANSVAGTGACQGNACRICAATYTPGGGVCSSTQVIFAITVPSVQVGRGLSTTVPFSTTATAAPSISFSGLPQGVTLELQNMVCDPACHGDLFINTTTAATPGTSIIDVSAVGGASTTMGLTVRDDLFLYFKFDADDNYPLVTDASGSSNSGIAMFSPSHVEGYKGKAYQFTGSQYVHVLARDLTGPYTVSAWVYPTASSGSLGVVGSQTPQTYGFDMKLYPGFVYGNFGTGATWINSMADAPYPWQTNTWYHLVYSVDSTGFAAYMNGEQIMSSSHNAVPLLTDTTHLMKIGWTGVSGQYFVGMIDDVKVYNRSLNADEVQALYRS